MKSQSQILAEFDAELAKEKDEQKQVAQIIEFTIIYGDSFTEVLVPYLKKGIEVSKRIGFEAGEIICYYNLTFFQMMTKGGEEDISNLIPKLSLEEQIEKLKADPYWYGLGMNILSYNYWFRGQYDKAFNCIFEAIRHSEQYYDVNLAWQYFAIAVFYFDTKDLESSESYYRRSYNLFKEFNFEYGLARSGNGLATVYIHQNKIDKANPLLEEAVLIYREFNQYSGLGRALNDLGLIEKVQKNYANAIERFTEAINVRNAINHLQGLITTHTELGETYLEMGNHEKTLEHFVKALELAKAAHSKQKEMRLQNLLYKTQKKLGNLASALEHFEMFDILRQDILSVEATNNIRRLQSKFEKERSEKETEIERLKNVELKMAYQVIEQKNKDINDSIHYAKRIQHSLITSEKYIERTIERLTGNN